MTALRVLRVVCPCSFILQCQQTHLAPKPPGLRPPQQAQAARQETPATVTAGLGRLIQQANRQS